MILIKFLARLALDFCRSLPAPGAWISLVSLALCPLAVCAGDDSRSAAGATLPGQVSETVLAASLAAVGELEIPTVRLENGYRRHFDERCSATLVAARGGAPSDLLLTAWHCLEYYRDLSRPMVYEHSDGTRSTVRALASGGGMHRDWALLRSADRLAGAVALAEALPRPGSPLVMAGFSRRDDGREATLAMDRDCRMLGAAAGEDALSRMAGDVGDQATTCHARRGASGGAVFAADGGGYLGVISRGDSANYSIFVPAARIIPALRPYLQPQTLRP